MLNVVGNIRDDVGERCQFVNKDQAMHREGDGEPVPCCKRCDDPCGYECNRSRSKRWEKIKIERGLVEQEPNQDKKGDIINADFKEVEQEKEDDRYESLDDRSDLEIAQDEVEKANALLKDFLKYYTDNDKRVRKQKILVAAIASFVCDLDAIENPEPKLEQPELPVMKNNDQRASFIDTYETWPVWIETKETGEKYYRYDLPDGTSIVVKVYHAMLFDYKAYGRKYEERFSEGYGRHEYYLLHDGKFFRDCETNRSALIEKLKEIQKKGE
jgi:hypothetical protein